ncbi:MAG: ABC transporter permease [Epsilonproteobacteria bacterium]|nr:MAG: ABC transporter permease [Campylobacterota bacterium]RLA68056.1 MAG: ABC transporter permease [Campylobacterota bacterium]
MISPSLKTIFRREVKGYFATPVGYVFIVIFLFSIGYVTFEPGRGSFFMMRKADLGSFFKYIPWLFVFLVPAIAMRLWSEERKTGTIELLLTLPVSIKEAVLGKFLAAWFIIFLSLLLTFPMALTVAYLGNPDWGVIFLGYLGALLLGGAFLAIGSFFSALTKNQVISFILSVGTCYVLTMAGSPPILEFLSNVFPSYVVSLFESLSMLNHFESLTKGLLRLSDMWFYMVMMMGWLIGCGLLLRENKAN